MDDLPGPLDGMQAVSARPGHLDVPGSAIGGNVLPNRPRQASGRQRQ
jgi:hypothetical protein